MQKAPPELPLVQLWLRFWDLRLRQPINIESAAISQAISTDQRQQVGSASEPCCTQRSGRISPTERMRTDISKAWRISQLCTACPSLQCTAGDPPLGQGSSCSRTVDAELLLQTVEQAIVGSVCGTILESNKLRQSVLRKSALLLHLE